MNEQQITNEDIPVASTTDAPIIDNEQPTEDGKTTQSNQPEDLISRATRFVQETKPEGKSDDKIDTEFWGDAELMKQLDAIEDPAMRDQLKGLRKSLVSGANKKYEVLADKLKQIEQLQTNKSESWTPERINALMNDPEFVQAAQQVAGTTTDSSEDDDYLPDSVKQKLSKLEQMEKQLSNMQTSQLQQWRQSEHEKLAQKYADYNPTAIDEISKNVVEGKAQITLEDIYKAANYDKNIQSVYELGVKDGQNGTADAKQIHTLSSVDTKPVETREDDKSLGDKAHFIKNALANLAKSKKTTAA